MAGALSGTYCGHRQLGKCKSGGAGFSQLTARKRLAAEGVAANLKSMPYLSEILLQNHDIESFAELVAEVRRRAAGELFLHMDIKPPYFDTPDNWEDVLEAAFTGVSPGPRDG